MRRPLDGPLDLLIGMNNAVHCRVRVPRLDGRDTVFTSSTRSRDSAWDVHRWPVPVCVTTHPNRGPIPACLHQVSPVDGQRDARACSVPSDSNQQTALLTASGGSAERPTSAGNAYAPSILIVIEHDRRHVHLADITAHPPGPGSPSRARNLLTDLGNCADRRQRKRVHRRLRHRLHRCRHPHHPHPSTSTAGERDRGRVHRAPAPGMRRPPPDHRNQTPLRRPTRVFRALERARIVRTVHCINARPAAVPRHPPGGHLAVPT
jgi:hypothetical protein